MSIKEQAMTEFVGEMTPREQLETPEACLAVPQALTYDDLPWVLYVDGSSNQKGCGAGLLLVSPERGWFEYALQFKFWASNNEVKYKALLAGLQMATKVRVTNLTIFSDSQLIMNQVGNYMVKYLAQVKKLLSSFSKNEIQQILRLQNANADSFA